MLASCVFDGLRILTAKELTIIAEEFMELLAGVGQYGGPENLQPVYSLQRHID